MPQEFPIAEYAKIFLFMGLPHDVAEAELKISTRQVSR